MFKATEEEIELTAENDVFTVYRWDEVYTKDGWVSCSKLKAGDDLDGCIIKSIELIGNNYIIGV